MQIALIIIGSIVAIFFVFGSIMKRKMKNTPMVEDHENVITLTESNFKQQTKNKLMLVDFWAEWCAPCRMMAPVLNEVAAELDGDFHVGKVDIQKYQSLATKYNVRSIPTLVLFKNGKEVNRFVGIKSKAFLIKEMGRF